MKKAVIGKIKNSFNSYLQNALEQAIQDYYEKNCSQDIYISFEFDADSEELYVNARIINAGLNKKYIVLNRYSKKILYISENGSTAEACTDFYLDKIIPVIEKVLKTNFDLNGYSQVLRVGDYYTVFNYIISMRNILKSTKLNIKKFENAKQIGINKFNEYKKTPQYAYEIETIKKNKLKEDIIAKAQMVFNKNMQTAMNKAVKTIYSIKNYPYDLAIVFSYSTNSNNPYNIEAKIMASDKFDIKSNIFEPIEIGNVSIKLEDAVYIVDDIIKFLEYHINNELVSLLINHYKIPGRAEHYNIDATHAATVFKIDLQKLFE